MNRSEISALALAVVQVMSLGLAASACGSSTKPAPPAPAEVAVTSPPLLALEVRTDPQALAEARKLAVELAKARREAMLDHFVELTYIGTDEAQDLASDRNQSLARLVEIDSDRDATLATRLLAARARVLLGDEGGWQVFARLLAQGSAADQLQTLQFLNLAWFSEEHEIAAPVRRAIAALVNSRDAQVREAAGSWDPRFEGWNAAQKRARAGQPRPVIEDGGAVLVAAGLFTPSELEAARQAQWESGEFDDAEPDTRTFDLLERTGRLLWTDAETDELPVRHDRLLAELAAVSGGTFAIEAASERWLLREEAQSGEGGEESLGYEVRFIHRERLYRFHCQDYGDWYDLEAVSAAVNRALADAGAAERFLTLHTDGQDAAFLFATPEHAARLAQAGLFKLADSPSAARDTGKAFEDEVRRQLDPPQP